MTATIATMYPLPRPSGWAVLFAEDSDKDLDFDEGFEEDDLHQSKPPSRRPLLWLLLLVLVGGVVYWFLNAPTRNSPNSPSMHTAESLEEAASEPSVEEMFPPMFHENQTVVLTEGLQESMLMGNPTNSEPGPIVKAGEPLTILDGLQQLHGWIYQVRTITGKMGWVSEEKLKKS